MECLNNLLHVLVVVEVEGAGCLAVLICPFRKLEPLVTFFHHLVSIHMHSLCILEPWDVEGSGLRFDDGVEFEDLYHVGDPITPTTHQVSYPQKFFDQLKIANSIQ